MERQDVVSVQSKNWIESDIVEANNKIEHSREIMNNNQQEFDLKINELDKSLKPKFMKLINSKGTAISEINDEICSGCNFKIPSSLAVDAAKDDKVSACSNCGRFIYVDSLK